MEIKTLVLNNNLYRYASYENHESDQYCIMILGAMQDISSVDSFAQLFSKGINCITVEVPGTGWTRPLPASVSIRDQSNMLLDFIRFMELDRVHIMAFSYATAIAVELCSLWSGVMTMSICCGVPGIPDSGRQATIEMIIDAMRDKNAFAKTFTRSLTSDNPNIPRNKVISRAMIKNISSFNEDRMSSFFENSLRLLAHKPSPISNINIPCMVCVGEYDPYVTKELAFEFSQQLPNSHFIVIKNADHLVHLQQPTKVAQVMILLAHNSVYIARTLQGLAS